MRNAAHTAGSRTQVKSAFKPCHTQAHAQRHSLALALALPFRAYARAHAPARFLALAVAVALPACARTDVSTTSTSIGQSPISVFTLTNARGLQVRVMEYGATILSIRVPDRPTI
jgi:hypothetical protein